MNFLDKTPFLRLFVFLAAGICVAYAVDVPWWVVVLCGSFGVAGLLINACLRKSDKAYRFRGVFGVAICLLLMACGMLSMQQFDHKTKLPFAGESGNFDVLITSQPIEKARSMMCHAEVLAQIDSAGRQSFSEKKVILYFAKDTLGQSLRIARGDRLLIASTIDRPQLSGNPNEFDYGRYLHNQGVGGTGYVAADDWRLVAHTESFSLLAVADRCRQYLLGIYRKMGLSGDEFGMLAALTLGYKDALTDELRESFSTTGAMHVLAVSGLHVGIIYGVLAWLLACVMPKTKRSERIRSLLIIAFLWFFAFVTGLSPSVMRATLMFSFMAFAGVIGRKSQTYNTIFLSAFLLLLYRPTMLFEVGFQLSYSAVLAIIYFQPKIVALLPVSNKIGRWAWELTAVSLAAQIGTAPFSIFYFHQFPNYFLLSNFVVIPAATVILYLAILLFVTSWIPYVGMAFAWLLNWVLKAMYFLISCIEHLPHALTTIWIDRWQMLLIYLVIFAVGLCCFRFSFRNVFVALLLILTTVSLHIFERYRYLTSESLVVFNHSKTLLINKITPSENFVVTNDSALCRQLAADFWTQHEALQPTFADSTLTSRAFTFADKRFLVLDRNLFRHQTTDQTLEVDYLVVNRAVYPSDELLQHIRPKTLVTAGDVYDSRNAKFRQLTDSLDIDFVPIREELALKITHKTE